MSSKTGSNLNKAAVNLHFYKTLRKYKIKSGLSLQLHYNNLWRARKVFMDYDYCKSSEEYFDVDTFQTNIGTTGTFNVSTVHPGPNPDVSIKKMSQHRAQTVTSTINCDDTTNVKGVESQPRVQSVTSINISEVTTNDIGEELCELPNTPLMDENEKGEINTLSKLQWLKRKYYRAKTSCLQNTCAVWFQLYSYHTRITRMAGTTDRKNNC